MERLPLHCHPQTPAGPVRAIDVRVVRHPDGRLALSYRVRGDVMQLLVPETGPVQPGERLWEHTCCECFVARAPGGPYHEFNFSPSGAWAAHGFGAYREGGPLVDPALTPDLAVRRSAGGLELDAVIPLDALSAAHRTGMLWLAISAVIETRAGARSYWALWHPHGAPDFHHRDAFVLRVETPEAGC